MRFQLGIESIITQLIYQQTINDFVITTSYSIGKLDYLIHKVKI